METAKVKLADNSEYTISSLTVGDLIEVEKKFGSLTVDTAKIENIVFWIWLSLKRNHKEMTLEKLYDLIDAPFMSSDGLTKIFEIMTKLNGWDKVGTVKNALSPAEEKQA